jgi:hypothetical protein
MQSGRWHGKWALFSKNLPIGPLMAGGRAEFAWASIRHVP